MTKGEGHVPDDEVWQLMVNELDDGVDGKKTVWPTETEGVTELTVAMPGEQTVNGLQLGTDTVARTVAAASGWSILMTDDDGGTGGGGQNAVENGVKILASGKADRPEVTIGRLSTT